MISARVICDSISPQGKRLTTFVLRYPKFIHGEAKTHRVLSLGDEGFILLDQEVGLMDDKNMSRNASSSRAVPVWKMLEEVRSDELRAAPVFWGAEQKGMGAVEELPPELREQAERLWKLAALNAADLAQAMTNLGLHKNLANRVLEPFSHINVVASATEWDNFFGLRLHKDAQPEMRTLAEAMWRAWNESEVTTLRPGQWHLPFIDLEDREIVQRWIEAGTTTSPSDDLIKVSVARCARVSYTSFETKKRSTFEEDVKLHDRLLAMQPKSMLPMPLHASPAEHQATPDSLCHIMQLERGPTLVSNRRHEWGNLVGWRQYRKMLPGEAVAPLPEGYKKS